MRKNRIFITAALALFLVFTAIRVERAAPQDPQSNKPADKTSNSQLPEQKPGGQDRIPPFLTDLVSLPVTVTDTYNRLVSDLHKQDFEVFEDKVKQEISFFSDVDAPVNLGII